MLGRQRNDIDNSYAAFLQSDWGEEQHEEGRVASAKLQRIKTAKTAVSLLVWFALSLNISLWARDSDNRIWAWLVLGGLRASVAIALFSKQTGDAKAEAIAGSIATIAGMIGGSAY